ncbi:proprotein convertase P-domain-containing protein [Dactylosporangium siamense]|uniref:P/Homo B domain-containing protein n=1 Tax=Dactylosporangium siamense TaxID=685454 RepID=A0A919UHM2_9ACTN|nr:proprotein convertase P-domain-containing protein [Dactylosporangium siamense]GIG52541.1 hypothetical protein Dsi01nite_105820 [Dactylosporangium siamense]
MGTASTTARRRLGAGLLAVLAAIFGVLFTAPTAATAATNDFSIALSPPASEVQIGNTVMALISTTTTSGAAQPLNLTVSGLPGNVIAHFAFTTITSGTQTAVTFGAVPGATTGTYPITITATGTSATHTAVHTLTVTNSPSCSVATNPTDVPVPDLSTAESTVTYTGCPGNASAASTVEVHIVHPFRGDLVVSLVAPDGSSYLLANRQGGATQNLDQVYTVNLSSEARNGTWRLRVQDAAQSDTGFINAWTLNLGAPPSTCTGANPTDVTIVDLATVESAVTLAGCTGNAAGISTVEVHIVHTYRGDLVVSLVAPDGSVYVLSNRQGASADNIDQTYTVDLTSEARNGTWRLRVQDAASADTGFINTWTLTT